ncbi:MAG: glutaredoxin domain-containing protein [Anaerolineae bacterium]
MDVTVYSAPGCPYCRQVKEYLRARGILFRDVDVSRDTMAAHEMVQRSGQRGVPVVDIDGQMVVGFDRARLDAILSKRKPKPKGLGALVADAADMAAAGKTKLTTGAYIGRVKAGSAAERAGLRAGDVIVAIAGNPVRSASALQTLISRVPRGRQVSIEYARNGQRLTVTVAL